MLDADQHIPVTHELWQIVEQPTTATKLRLSPITGPDQIRAVHNHAILDPHRRRRRCTRHLIHTYRPADPLTRVEHERTTTGPVGPYS